MKWLTVICFLSLVFCSCAVQNNHSDLKLNHTAQFNSVVQLIEKKNIAEAEKELESILSGPPSQGVSDEALYRLGLIRLGDNNGDEQIQKSLQLLQLLVKVFPSSQWTYMAKPVIELVNNEENLKKQIKNLKGLIAAQAKENNDLKIQKSSFLAVQRENKELKQRLERLKELDIQLEKKSH